MRSFKGDTQYRKTHNWHRSASLLLIILLFIGILSFAGSAQNNNAVKVITSFDMPVIEVIVSPGTVRGDIPLPETLAATLEGGAVTNIPVTWEDGNLYNENLPGQYAFMADIGTYIYGQARPVAIVSVLPGEEATPSDATPSSESVNFISGKIWMDENLDGIMDETESGVAGYPVSLYRADNMEEAVQTTQTQEDGNYLFENIESGEYIVSIASEVVEGREYRLPMVGVAEDNKFKLIELDDLVLVARSETLIVSEDEDTAVEKISAGVYLLPNTRAGAVRNVGNFTQLKTALMQSASQDIIVITNNITFTEPLTIDKALTFRSSAGNKFTLKQSSHWERHFIIEPADSIRVELTFENIILDGGSTGGGIYIADSKTAELNLYNSVIQNCYAKNGGAILFGTVVDRNADAINQTDNFGDLIINGGRFDKNEADGDGGGIYVNGGMFIVRGTEISNGYSKAHGAGICINNNSALFDGSAIYGNTTLEGYGGGLAIYESLVEMVNCEINNNLGLWQGNDDFGVGGGFYVFKSELYLDDSIFEGNRGSSGGAISIYDTELVMNNTDFVNNWASISGGAISNYGFGNGKTVTINNARILNNEANIYGGGIYNILGNIKVTNSEISGGTSKYGGGIYSEGSSLIVSSTEILNNKAVTGSGYYPGGQGGGIFGKGSGNIIIKDNSKITGNAAEYSTSATGNGGGVYLTMGTQMTVEAGEISNNTAKQSGGGIYLENNQLIIKKGNIENNTAKQMGGGIYSTAGGIVRVESGNISGNMAPDGGGIYAGAIANLTVTSPSVVFSNNVAATANEKSQVDMNMHAQKIHTTYFTAPFDFAYSNYDVGYKKSATGVFYTVTFDSQGGDYVPSKLIPAGGTVAVPTPEPIKAGYTFGGWYKEEACENLWNFTSDTVLSDMTLYAKWGQEQEIDLTVSKTVEGEYSSKTKEFTFTIRFKDKNGNLLPSGTELIYTGEIISGSGAAAPANGVLTLDSNGEAEFNLKHGQQIVILGITPNSKVQIIEIDTAGYTTTFKDGNEVNEGADTGERSLSDGSRTFAFTNTEKAVVPTGVMIGSVRGSILLIISMLLMGIAFGAVQVCLRRKRGL